MKYYAGLDVSSKETAICVMNQGGEIICETMVSTEPKDIDQYFSSIEVSLELVGIEASNISIWLHNCLTRLGYPITMIESHHAKSALAAQNVKTDKNDARGIAHIMRTGWYKPVHVKSDPSQRLKMLLNNRKCLVEQRVLIENQIRGSLKTFGIKVGEVTTKKYTIRVSELIEGDGELEMAVYPLLSIRNLIIKEISQFDKILCSAAEGDKVCRQLMTIPSVGALTALLFVAIIDEPARFKKSKNIPVHLGLTPRKYASGEVDYNGGITKSGDSLIRGHLYEAAAFILRPSSKPNPLKSWGLKLAKRSSIKKARVAVARKLSIIMHRMWIDETEFDWGDIEKIPQVLTSIKNGSRL